MSPMSLEWIRYPRATGILRGLEDVVEHGGSGIYLLVGPPNNGKTAILDRERAGQRRIGHLRFLEIHHKEFRSHSGHDSDENLITLCTTCHAHVHGRGGVGRD